MATPRLPAGDPPTIRGAMAHVRGLREAFDHVYEQLWASDVVDRPTKEVVRIRNARITDCGH